MPLPKCQPAGERPNSGITIVSTLQLQDAIQYRVLGAPTGYTAQPIEPSLEDGYMWLMRCITDAGISG